MSRISVSCSIKRGNHHNMRRRKERGSLEVGKIADFAILSDNVYELEKEKICNTKVLGLYLNGKEVFRK